MNISILSFPETITVKEIKLEMKSMTKASKTMSFIHKIKTLESRKNIKKWGRKKTNKDLNLFSPFINPK
jgi:hypothetical protein